MAVADNVIGSATHGFAVVKSDSENFTQAARALYVGTGGDVVLVTKGGSTLTFKNVGNGQVLDVRATRVNATGTTAADIVALI